MDNALSFDNKIISLINNKVEGEFWDFKREWYLGADKLGDLLHDILCMANNPTDSDGYIIIGVDEEKDHCILDIAADENRKSTRDIVDFLRTVKFAGGIRPTVYVKTISLDSKSIDIIVVRNDTNTPYYLAERCRSVSENNIYTRKIDSNTPVNKSADINEIEHLWKKRFGIERSPLERMQVYLLNAEDWDTAPSEDIEDVDYYKYAPEFTISSICDEDQTGHEFYMFAQPDKHPAWYMIKLYYHQTLLRALEGVSLDGGRYFTPAPCRRFIQIRSRTLEPYYYFEKGSLEDCIHHYYLARRQSSDVTAAYDRFKRLILFFESQEEHAEFKRYLVQSLDKINPEQYRDNLPMELRFEESESNSLVFTNINIPRLADDYINALAFQAMLTRFRAGS